MSNYRTSRGGNLALRLVPSILPPQSPPMTNGRAPKKPASPADRSAHPKSGKDKPRAASTVENGKPSKNPFADKPSKADTFPLVSVLERADMDRVIEIMKDDTELAEQIDGLELARKMMKAELAEIGERTGNNGLKWGPFVAYIRGMRVKKTMRPSLVKEAWVEEGLDPKLLDACYSESDPYPDVRIVDTSKPRKTKSEDDDD